MANRDNPIIKKLVDDWIREDEHGLFNLYVSDWTFESDKIDVSLKDICDLGEWFPVRFQFDGTDTSFYENLKEAYLNYDPVSAIAEYERKNHSVYSFSTGVNCASIVMRIQYHLMLFLSDFSKSSPYVDKPNTPFNTYDPDPQLNQIYTKNIDDIFRENGWSYIDHFTSEEGQIIMWKRPLGHHDDAYCAIFYDGTLKGFCDTFHMEKRKFSPSDCVRNYRHSQRYDWGEDEIKIAENAKAIEESYQAIWKVLEKKYGGDENYGT